MFLSHSRKGVVLLTMLLVNSSCPVSFSVVFVTRLTVQLCSSDHWCSVVICSAPMCVWRPCVLLWFTLMSCRPWPLFSVGRMWCVRRATLSTPLHIYWLKKQIRGCRWSSSTTTSSQVCVCVSLHHDMFRALSFAKSCKICASTF